MNVFAYATPELARELPPIFSKLAAGLRVETSADALFNQPAPRGGLVLLDADLFSGPRYAKALRALRDSRRKFLVVSSDGSPASIRLAHAHGSSDFITKPFNQRELILRSIAVIEKKTRIACLGGGTGLFTLLLGLKGLPKTLLFSIVSMSDDGGSSGKLSQTFGILPPGDVRRSLVALSNAPALMNQVIQHRFERRGELQGHSFGNIFLTVLAEVKGSMAEAVRALSDILNIQGIVLPATRTLTKLVARFEGGKVIRGESRIDRCEGRRADAKLKQLWHEPVPECEGDAYAAILHADVVTIGPGDLYTSVVANLAVPEIRDAVARTRAKKIYICNLMTKPGETFGYSAADHVREVRRYIGRDALDAVLISTTAFSPESIAEYEKMNQKPVPPGGLAALRRVTRAKIVLADVGHETELVRHDSEKLRAQLSRLISR